MELSGSQEEQFSDALRSAFNQATLQQMLRFKLDKSLEEFATTPDFRQTVFLLIENSRMEGWTEALIDAALQSRPGNPHLRAFADQLGLVSTGNRNKQAGRAREFERLITPQNGFADPAKWLDKLGRIESQVCRIEVPTTEGICYGTGFLVSPNAVMTNYHVIQALIENVNDSNHQNSASVDVAKVICRFDYRMLIDGVTINSGTTYTLDPRNWLLAKSPPSPSDDVPEPKREMPEMDQMDFVLLRLEGTPGNDYPGKKGWSEIERRGWISARTRPYEFPKDAFLFVMQHPKAAPLKLAFGAVIAMNPNQTRVRYTVNTEPGSSGAPCFDKDLNLVALHHLGDPNLFAPASNSFNQGIPLFRIQQLLEKRGVLQYLSEQQ